MSTLKRKHEDEQQLATTSHRDDSKDGVDLTASQQHERKLAELAVKLQTLENEALEKKNTAELRRLEIEAEAEERRRIAEHNNQRAKEKHELMMKMMAMAMGKTVPDDADNP